MRLLADENVPTALVESLRLLGHDVASIREATPSAPDPDVLAQANEQQRVLLTYDTDFGELIFRHHYPASEGVILLRLPQPTQFHTSRVVEALGMYDDWSDYFTTVTAEDERRRRLPRQS